MKRGRPYPPDREREAKVKTELIRRGMTASTLAEVLRIHRGNLSSIINGTRISPKTEEKIARYFGLSREELFPPRTNAELEALRRAAGGKGRAA
jgi:plasmid maintenance system antidote protein VapI